MNKILKNRNVKILSVVIALLIVTSWLIFSKGNYKSYKSEDSFKALMGVMLESINNKGVMILEEKDINALASSYLKEGINKGGLIIGGLNVNVNGEKVTALIPIKYKGFSMLFSTKGNFQFKEDSLWFTPDYFKIGKISLPKKYVMNLVKNKFGSKIKEEEGSLVVGKGIIPFEFNSIELIEGKFVIVSKGETNELIKNTSEAISKLEQEVKAQIAKESQNKANNSSQVKDSTKNTSNNEKTNNNTSGDSKNEAKESEDSLNKIYEDLNGLQGNLATSKEKQMISIMSSAINNIKTDSDYNFWNDMDKVMDIYKTLSPQEKKNFKTKVLSNIDLENALKIKDNYGI
ncbi:hypothetical protein CLHOM_21670 [Clostridium homopropionicum DSM 5847]|uniref:Uncharacterized protein n=1 Tax=Clostridium homopropionicum DSM 5847 TaxID=1121318 RepID=A0A0L6Z8S1_9CLOT|nr:hypothetical protein [Clostridium homopropionicum]KOA19376.1 hypothetical protein CLHOM_21670 [Clostridium homopropionicum DSM 5847]SFG67880.1 hypothetical protein SAMN04488501_11315 [Clostridium homopropionicum]